MNGNHPVTTPARGPNRRVVTALTAIALGGIGLYFVGQSYPAETEHFGLWSLVPPALAILLAFWLREVISALAIGILAGGLIAGQVNVIDAFLIPSIGTENYALILLVYLWALGGLIGIWTRTGGAARFAEWAGERMVRSPRSARVFTWCMGLVFHQGGTISTVLTGTTARPLADQHRVSHEELSYITDSTASPAATLIPFNVWPIYVGGLLAGTIPLFGNSQEGIQFFFQALPYNFYAIAALLLTLLFALGRLPFSPGRRMRNAIDRARETGKLDRDGARPMTAKELTEHRIPEHYRTGLIDFLAPMGVLLGTAIIPYFVSYFLLGWTGGEKDPLLLVAEAFILAVITAIVVALVKGMPFEEVITGFVDGCKGVTIGAIILGLAVSLKEVTDAVGTAQFLVSTVGDSIPAVLLPALLFGLCLITAFATGTSWGTYAVMIPIAMPLAWHMAPDPFFITLCFSGVIGGAVFGDQCSPISDTTVLSSLATGADLMDHVRTQIPLTFIAGGIAVVCYTLLALVTGAGN